MVFASDERQNKGIQTLTGKANTALRDLDYSMVTQSELRNTSKFYVFVPILTHLQETSEMTD